MDAAAAEQLLTPNFLIEADVNLGSVNAGALCFKGLTDFHLTNPLVVWRNTSIFRLCCNTMKEIFLCQGLVGRAHGYLGL